MNDVSTKMSVPKNGYLYAVFVTNSNGASGYFSRSSNRRRNGTGSRLLPELTQDSFWVDRADMLKKAKRSTATQACASYLVYEFVYAANRVDDEGTTPWNGKIRVHTDAHGQYLLMKGNVYRPQPSVAIRTWPAMRPGDDVPGDLDVERVKASVYRCYNNSSFFAAEGSFAVGDEQARSIAMSAITQAFDVWCADPTTPITGPPNIRVNTRDGMSTQWFNHGLIYDVVFPDKPTVEDRHVRLNTRLCIYARAELTRTRKKHASTTCWHPLEK